MRTPFKISILIVLMFTTGSLFSQKTRFTVKQIQDANTAFSSVNLTQAEKDIVLYINLARMYPKQFFQLYIDSLAKVHNLTTHDHFISLKTLMLKNVAALPLEINDNLVNMSSEMQEDAVKNNTMGHTDSKGRDFSARADKFNLETAYAENISYGASDALEVIFNWLIDTNTESLGHRENMLDTGYKKIGVSYSDGICVIDLEA